MNGWDWQLFAAAACVAWAAWVLIRRGLRVAKTADGCGGDDCQSCSSATTARGGRENLDSTFVPVSELRRPKTN